MNLFEKVKKKKNDPCWKGYAQLGTKNKDGKEVPNCVPVSEAEYTVKTKILSGSEDKEGPTYKIKASSHKEAHELAQKRGDKEGHYVSTVTPVNEVSDETLKSYTKGAMRDTISGKKDRNSGMKKAYTRLAGLNKPIVEDEQLDEMVDNGHMVFSYKSADGKKTFAHVKKNGVKMTSTFGVPHSFADNPTFRNDLHQAYQKASGRPEDKLQTVHDYLNKNLPKGTTGKWKQEDHLIEEQLDELSSVTLRQYRKAVDNSAESPTRSTFQRVKSALGYSRATQKIKNNSIRASLKEDEQLEEGWKKIHPSSQEKQNLDRVGRKVKTPTGEEGTIHRESKVPTFSTSVPFKHYITVKYKDGSTITHPANHIKLIKEDEQLEEICQATKDSYKMKASEQIKQAEPYKDDKEVGSFAQRLIARRKKGLKLAEERMPLKGHAYHKKSDDELKYIIKDAGETARVQKGMSSENKYLDQVNDASTVLHYRKNGGKRVTEASDVAPGDAKEPSTYVRNKGVTPDGEHSGRKVNKGGKGKITFRKKEENEST